MSITVDLSIFSPRWSREDIYSVELDKEFMEISMHARKTRATWRENLDPEWSSESIQDIMNNDSIYPPAITQDLFEYAWKEWRNGEISAQEVETELKELAVWINAVTRKKPNTQFWKRYF
ncbi:hypothetical protein [Polaromonas sp.]|uniref:hypothetical protein n=1 Tax=Polaromonas sp. TaxID=1869339 RepID=UPI0013B8140B|nr:hypothetical protein [Polaromonas sp.]NDP62968.1 hypothetical protein [Polaromonas sp.]